MIEAPIDLTGPEARAILAGRKTQLRLLVEPQPAKGKTIEWLTNIVGSPPSFAVCRPMSSNVRKIQCPFGLPGDRLWGREDFALEELGDDGQRVLWKVDRRAVWADDDSWPFYLELDYEPELWTPAIQMPRRFSRITLEIAGLRAQPLQSICEDGARAEGVEVPDGAEACPCQGEEEDPGPDHLDVCPWRDPDFDPEGSPYRDEFAILWNKLNGKRAPWSSNPWVWVLEFKRVEQEAKAA